jgi:hypothetical protein
MVFIRMGKPLKWHAFRLISDTRLKPVVTENEEPVVDSDCAESLSGESAGCR